MTYVLSMCCKSATTTFVTDCPTLTQTTSCNNKLPVKWRTTTTDPRGSILQRCHSVQFFKFHHTHCVVAHFPKYVDVEPISPPRQSWCAEEDHESVSTVSECDESSETGDTCDVHADAHPAEIDRLLVINFFFQDSRFEATCSNIDHQHGRRHTDLLERRISRMCQPVSFRAAGPLGRMLAWLRKSVGTVTFRVGRIIRICLCSRCSITQRGLLQSLNCWKNRSVSSSLFEQRRAPLGT